MGSTNDIHGARGRLARYVLHREAQEISGQTLLSRPLLLDKRIIAFMLDSGEMDPKLKPAVRIVYPDDELAPLLVHEDFQQRLRSFIQAAFQAPAAERKRLAFHLWGNAGAGKKLQVEQLFCVQIITRCCFVELSKSGCNKKSPFYQGL